MVEHLIAVSLITRPGSSIGVWYLLEHLFADTSNGRSMHDPSFYFWQCVENHKISSTLLILQNCCRNISIFAGSTLYVMRNYGLSSMSKITFCIWPNQCLSLVEVILLFSDFVMGSSCFLISHDTLFFTFPFRNKLASRKYRISHERSWCGHQEIEFSRALNNYNSITICPKTLPSMSPGCIWHKCRRFSLVSVTLLTEDYVHISSALRMSFRTVLTCILE